MFGSNPDMVQVKLVVVVSCAEDVVVGRYITLYDVALLIAASPSVTLFLVTDTMEMEPFPVGFWSDTSQPVVHPPCPV